MRIQHHNSAQLHPTASDCIRQYAAGLSEQCVSRPTTQQTNHGKYVMYTNLRETPPTSPLWYYYRSSALAACSVTSLGTGCISLTCLLDPSMWKADVQIDCC